MSLAVYGSGNKAWLRRRLHSAIVRDHLNERADERTRRRRGRYRASRFLEDF